ncbi:MAG: LytTR family DNA-binding domain-containing protein [Bacteroidota bacterium]
MKINCIVIEDEPLALKKIVDFIDDVEYLNLLEGFDNAVDAVGFLRSNSVDLVFLDIRMKKLTGIQFLESLVSKPKVIVTSAYDEYALKGYELNVSDYLLKPFSFDRFLKSVEKVYADLNLKKGEQKPDYIFIKTEYRVEKVELKDILFIKGMKDYLQIITHAKKIMTLQSFGNMMQILPDEEFVRVHNSYVVSIAKIENIERNRIRIGEELIPISDSYKECFYDLLKSKNFML